MAARFMSADERPFRLVKRGTSKALVFTPERLAADLKL
jgi:hypothetical protein